MEGIQKDNTVLKKQICHFLKAKQYCRKVVSFYVVFHFTSSPIEINQSCIGEYKILYRICTSLSTLEAYRMTSSTDNSLMPKSLEEIKRYTDEIWSNAGLSLKRQSISPVLVPIFTSCQQWYSAGSVCYIKSRNHNHLIRLPLYAVRKATLVACRAHFLMKWLLYRHILLFSRLCYWKFHQKSYRYHRYITIIVMGTWFALETLFHTVLSLLFCPAHNKRAHSFNFRPIFVHVFIF